MPRKYDSSRRKAKAAINAAMKEVVCDSSVPNITPPPGLTCPICGKKSFNLNIWRFHSKYAGLVVCSRCPSRRSAEAESSVYVHLSGKLVRAFIEHQNGSTYDVITDHGLAMRVRQIVKDPLRAARVKLKQEKSNETVGSPPSKNG